MNAVSQKKNIIRMGIACVLVLPLLASGCGNSSKTPVTGAGPLAGNWQMSMQPSNGNPSLKTESGFLLQSGDTVTGSLAVSDSPCSGVGSVTGTVNGTSVQLNIAPVGIQVSLTGTLGSDQASMTGTYTVITTGCSGRQTAPQSGTWSGNLVKPLNGTINASFVSRRFSITYPIGGQVSQGANTGTSNAPLTGTMTATGYCFASVNIAGVISGTSAVMNLLDPTSGAQIGEVTGVSTLDGTTVTGNYSIIPQGIGNGSACPLGDTGTVTLTL